MNALLIYPQFPDTYWSFKHALKFLGKRAAQPAAGADDRGGAVAVRLEQALVDTNVERLRDRDLDWADVVLLSECIFRVSRWWRLWSGAARVLAHRGGRPNCQQLACG